MSRTSSDWNALATTYRPFAKDVYAEGSLVFPAVRIQRDYADVADISACAGAGFGFPTSDTATT